MQHRGDNQTPRMRLLPARVMRTAPTLACLILLLISAAAGATGVPASPFRLVGTGGAIAPYQSDDRFRLQLPLGSAADDAHDARPYAREIAAAARDSGLDPELVHAVIAVESAYRATAVSPKGAVGLMQVLPETAQLYGVNDPARVGANLRAGTRHLRGLLDRFEQRLDLALAAYNAGEGAVRRHDNAIPPFPETRQYVPAVVARYRAQRPQAGEPRKLTYLAGTRADPALLRQYR